MSLRDNTQNLILEAGAKKQGHKFNREPGTRVQPEMKCLLCGKALFDLCEQAIEAVKANKPIPKCPKGELTW